ncbi:DUF1510 family protein [Niallia sp. 01092]|uniref:DUF1510 family protein n=1 Tax=unclassified Niallia TaxID=2837522 RepID=UPI003FCFBDE4
MSTEANNNQSRSEQRLKRRKTNLILNSLIGIVLLLIVFVSYSIFHTNDSKNADKPNKNNVKTEQTNKDDKVEAETVNGNANGSDKTADEETMAEEDEEKTDDEAIVTEGGSDSNVVKTIENPAWEPVGTTQTGEHAASYSSGADWDEQEKALAYGTGLDESDMVVWFLGNNNKDPQKSIGTVSSKDKSKKYRVYIEWVDGKGWKPTKVEEVKDLNIR